MTIFKRGVIAPLDKNNVDTDQIIPKQFLTSTSREGFDKALFYDWRYHDNGSENTAFKLNETRYKGASILLTRENFGCGSSREHAPWALKQYGFSVILAHSFADIFFNNCVNNQILAITLPDKKLDELFAVTEQVEQVNIDIDLVNQVIKSEHCDDIFFSIRPDIKQRLLSGLDFIGVTETFNDKIDEYEVALSHHRAWQ